MGEPQNSYAESKKSDKKESVLYDSIYIKFEKIPANIEPEQISCCLGTRRTRCSASYTRPLS